MVIFTFYCKLNADDGDIYLIPVHILNNWIYQKGICLCGSENYFQTMISTPCE